MGLLENADTRTSEQEQDLYSDIDHVTERIRAESDVISQIEAKAQESEQRAKKAKRELTAYKLKGDQLRQRCTMLEKNLSCLFKTAWEHLHRKDQQIVDLKQQIKEFRKVTGMVAPGVKSGDLNMQQWHSARVTDRPPQVESEQRANGNGCKNDVTLAGSPNICATRNPMAHDREANPADCPEENQEPNATDHAASARSNHRMQHRADGTRGKEQHRVHDRNGSAQDLRKNQAAPSCPRRTFAAESQAQSNAQQCPQRDREAQQCRVDREEREGRHRDSGHRYYRSRGSKRDSWDTRRPQNGSDLRASLGSERDRQRVGQSRQRTQGSRVRSRSP